MPRLSPAKGMVMACTVIDGKAIIEIKNPKASLIVELAEDSGWVAALPEGAIVTYTLDVELPRESVQLPTGPQPGDELRTSKGIEIVPEIVLPATKERAANIAPDPEVIRQLHPIPGMNTAGLDSMVAGGESMRDLLGLPTYAKGDGTLEIGSATPSSNNA